MKKVSIILPVYNGERYLKECIDSVVEQTYSDWELIICDDGSTDLTADICRNYVDADSRIKYIRQENSGVSAARNNAIKRSCGEYITFIDADDIFRNDRIQRQVELCTKYGADIVYTGMKRFTGELENSNYCVDKIDGGANGYSDDRICLSSHIEELDRNDSRYRALADGSMSFCACTLMRSNIAKQITFKNVRFAEDCLYMLDCLSLADKVVLSDEVLYYYRKDNQASMMSNITHSRYASDFERLPGLFYEYMRKNDLTGEFYKRKLGKEFTLAGVRLSRCLPYSDFKEHIDRLLKSNKEEFKWTLMPNDVLHKILYISLRCRGYFIYDLYRKLWAKVTR